MRNQTDRLKMFLLLKSNK